VIYKARQLIFRKQRINISGDEIKISSTEKLKAHFKFPALQILAFLGFLHRVDLYADTNFVSQDSAYKTGSYHTRQKSSKSKLNSGDS
jgi:hypothetical protein